MMTANEYLEGVLAKQKLTEAETNALQGLRKTVEDALRAEFGTAPRVYYGGSFGKKTMVRSAYDLDIVFYYPPDSTTTVKQVRNDVLVAFQKRGWGVTPKDVALRLFPESRGYHVDVVPGRAQDASFYLATLYRSRSDATLQTSVKAHIDAVADRRDLVKLMKLWSIRHSLHVKTFLLEQTAMAGAKGTSLTDLGEQMLAALRWVRDNLPTADIRDPANTNNRISDLATVVEKGAAADKARWCLQQDSWDKIVW